MPRNVPPLGRLVRLACLLLVLGLHPHGRTHAGDSLYGTVVNVKSPELISIASGNEICDIRILGIEAPEDKTLAKQATELLFKLAVDRKARTHLEYVTPEGEMLSRVFTDDPVIGIKDLGVELVKAGLAKRQSGFDYKYGELSAAEDEARKAQRGLWAVSSK